MTTPIPLPTPNELSQRIPLPAAARDAIAKRRADVARVLCGADPRFLLIAGPCSIHDEAAALDYADRLARLSRRVEHRVLLCMRVYLEKPRTSVGWKGFVHDPNLDGSADVVDGLVRARRLLASISELGLGIATELLDPILAEYHSEFLSWAAVGARTSESQIHRELASSRTFAVGFKNGTDGSVDAAIHAVQSAGRAHTVFGVGADGRVRMLESRGNPLCHVVLRGGKQGPNYSKAAIDATSESLLRAGLPDRVLVDCSHGNSGKDPKRQGTVLEAICEQRERGGPILGAMLESHLVSGQQPCGPRETLRYGQSITDACIDFEATEALVESIVRSEELSLRSVGVSRGRTLPAMTG